MKRLFATMLAVAAWAGAARAEPIELKLSTFEPPQGATASGILAPWAEMINRDSGGKLNVKLYPGGILGKPPQQYDVVKHGIADLAWVVLSYTPGRFPLSSAAELPFLFKSATAGTRALNTLLAEGLLAEEFKDVHVIGMHTMRSYHLMMRDKPIRKLSDLAGLRLRSIGAVHSEIVKALGASPIQIPAPGTYEALQRGVLDGAFGNYELYNTFRLSEVTHNVSELFLGNTSFALLMNKQKYESLPPDLRALIDARSGHAFGDWAAPIIDAYDEQIRQKIQAAKSTDLEVIQGPALDEFRKAMEPVVAAWLADMKQKNLPGETALARFREAAAQADK